MKKRGGHLCNIPHLAEVRDHKTLKMAAAYSVTAPSTSEQTQPENTSR